MTIIDVPARRLLDPSLVTCLQPRGDRATRSVLMFSGGRDSTLAALRMCERAYFPLLVTISSWHLAGLDRVRQRIRELESHLPSGTPWLILRQPRELKTDTSFYEQTCLPCHHAYVVAGAVVCAKAEATTLAFGYASYQGVWPEQPPLAIERLEAVLTRHGLRLLLPVRDITSRERAVKELAARNLSTEALEQKCIQQVMNITLSPNALSQQVSLWERAINVSMSALSSIEIEVMDATLIGRD